MPDFAYDYGQTQIQRQAVDWVNDSIRLALINPTAGTGYTPSQSGDQFLGVVVPAACIISRTVPLTGKTNVRGALDADDTRFTAVPSAAGQCTMFLVYKDTGIDNTSILLFKIDSYAGFPYTPNDHDISVLFPDDGYKIVQDRTYEHTGPEKWQPRTNQPRRYPRDWPRGCPYWVMDHVQLTLVGIEPPDRHYWRPSLDAPVRCKVSTAYLYSPAMMPIDTKQLTLP